MANEEHVAILKQGVEAWNQWRKENRDVRPDLSGANLSGANLWRADLSEAKLIEADLSGADLSGAYCGFTMFGDVDLSEAKGLETIRHDGPSTVGIDTLVISKGKIPEVFLRGCGVPEELIATFRYFFATAVIEFYSCFISYSHADKAFARRVHDTLQARGIRCWLDEKQVLPGHDILTEVDRGIKLWDKVLLCASRESLHSGWVDTELTKALEKERELTKERSQRVFALIPLDIDGYLLSRDYQSPIKSEIMRRSVAEFKGWDGDGGNAIFDEQM
ncbi:MAG: TIR domain-containing protein, partial [Anaerolineae bacterium]|nr:TIR domain-containing protein [Anaerolineae bacterium]